MPAFVRPVVLALWTATLAAQSERPPEAFQLAVGLQQRGLFDEAAEKFTAFLTEQPQHALVAEAHYRLGLCHVEGKRVDAAGAPRGEPAERTARDARHQGTQAAPEPVFEPVTADDESVPATERSGGGYTDGSDLEDEYASRPLSKAERKRLRKLAKSGQAA